MKNVIYFDGQCGLCNGFVDFVIKIDKKKIFYFSPLQSEYAKTHLPKALTTNLKTVVIQTDDNQMYQKTLAVLKVFEKIGGIWSVFNLTKILPVRVLDFSYDTVSKHRYRVFGKKESCRVPGPDERERFLI